MAVGSSGSARVPGNHAVFAREIYRKDQPQVLRKRHHRPGLWNHLLGGIPSERVIAPTKHDAPHARLTDRGRPNPLQCRRQWRALSVACALLIIVTMGLAGCNRRPLSSPDQQFKNANAYFERG